CHGVPTNRSRSSLEVSSLAATPVASRIRAVSRRPAKLPWIFAGSFATASAVSLAILLTLLGSGAFQIRTLGAAAAGAFSTIWEAWIWQLGTAIPEAARAVTGDLAILPTAAAAVGLWWLITIVSAVGLYRVLGSFEPGRKTSHALR
ncbi:MAG: hypothetical protein ACE5FJ_10415, partial [Gemmatimonadales bacterium]